MMLYRADKGLALFRFDVGELAAPITTGNGSVIYTGRAARTGTLSYPWGIERRDSSELARLVSQLHGTPVIMNHLPNKGLISEGVKAQVVGNVSKAWLDDTHAIVQVRVDDQDAIRKIKRGQDQLSLGYQISRLDNGFHRGSIVDHLAFVYTARCGVSCSVRLDASCGCGCGTCGESANQERGPILAVNIMRKQWKKN